MSTARVNRTGDVEVRTGLGDRLANLLRRRRMTQTELAKLAGVSRQTLFRALHRDELSVTVARKLAKALNVRSADLLVPTSVKGRNQIAGGVGVVSEPASSRTATPTTSDPNVASVIRPGLTGFGNILEILREDGGRTQDDLSERLEISVATYRRLITGKAPIHSRLIDRIALAFEVGAEDVFAASARSNRPGEVRPLSFPSALRAWRLTTDIDLRDAGHYVGLRPVWLAVWETGPDMPDEDSFNRLSYLYGIPAEVLLFRNESLALEDEESPHLPDFSIGLNDLVSSDRLMHFALQMATHRVDGPGDHSNRIADRLRSARSRLGYERAALATYAGVAEATIASWERDGRQVDEDALARIATVLESSPWELRYGDARLRALEFPFAADERSQLFAERLPVRVRGFLYGFLQAIASQGLGEFAVNGVKRYLAEPFRYSDLAYLDTPDDRVHFMEGRMRELARDTWSTIVAPGWQDRGESPPRLPDVFNGWDKSDDDRYAAITSLAGERRSASARDKIDKIPPEKGSAAAIDDVTVDEVGAGMLDDGAARHAHREGRRHR